jgi:Putative peptidoglycan binding domain
MPGIRRDFDDRFHRFDFDHRFRFRNRTFVFVDAFGFPFFSPFAWGAWGYPYPYPYPYYPYGGYYGSSYNGGAGDGSAYSDRSQVAALQRQLARAGYYHGAIDGIFGPQTQRAVRAYQRDHNAPA